MLGWCWHRWSKWIDASYLRRFVWEKEWSECAAQERECLKCGRKQLRRKAF